MTEEMKPQVEQYTVRNAYQWLAMITMLMDHLGYVYYISPLRYFGRLGMPLYALLFVMTVRSGHINFKRLLLIALASQIPVMYIFYYETLSVFIENPVSEWTLTYFTNIQLNIIFGFAIFALIIDGMTKRRPFQMGCGILLMMLPVSYGWYLYTTLFIFWGVRNKYLQTICLAVTTGGYVWVTKVHLRQLLAISVPLIGGIKAVRPNKYFYRYFYPGHLIIVAILKYLYDVHGVFNSYFY